MTTMAHPNPGSIDQKSVMDLESRILSLKTELQDRMTEIAMLKETGDAVSSELDLDKVYQLVSDHAQKLIQSETLLVPVLSEDCSEYTYRAGTGKNVDQIVGESLPLELGVCGWVWRHKRPWWRGVLDELDEEERNRWEKEAGTIILVPLIGKRHFLGGLAGINKIGGGEFDKRDLDLLTLFANQVAIAIENALLFEEMNRAKLQAEGYQHELQILNTELEKRVEERTAELLSANNQLRQEVSDRERTEEKLKSFMYKLEQSNHELEDFAHVASHDLQEPLRKVTAFGDRLKTKYEKELGEQGRDYLERMQSAATRMQTLINGLLTYSRVTSKKQPFISVDLNTVVQEVLSDLEVRIEQTRGSVETGNLPEVFGDPLQMRQLMQNLIGNALKFTKKDEPPVIRISSRTMPTMESGDPQEKGLYEITVQDNGIGFDEKYADRIFGVFQRLHGRGEYEGTGIGLSVCRKIAEHHGGSIEAKSQPGQGSAFVIRLPLNQHEG